jgi:hypothetical protein
VLPHFGLGQMYIFRGDMENAAQCFEKVKPVLRIRDVYPFSIPDPGPKRLAISDPDPQNNLSILTPNFFL